MGTSFVDRSAFNWPCVNILRASQEAIVMIDEEQTVVAFNPAAEAMFSLAADAVLGQPLVRLVPPGHRESHEQHVRRFAASNEMQRRIAPGRHISAVRADGSEFPVEVTLSRVDIIVDGRPRHWFAALLRDLTKEDALRDEVDVITRRLHAALDATPLAIWITHDERIEYANDAAAWLLGVAGADALRGRSLASLLPATTLAELRRQASRQEGGPAARVPGLLTRGDGAVRDIEIVLAPLPDHGQTVLQMVIDDVTERRRAAADLERTGQMLRLLQANVVEAREEERRRISRELHDELGQRLTALKMELTGLADRSGLGAGDPRLAGMLTMLDETVAAVRRIASDLRPLMLDDLGLNAAIEWLARDMARRSGIDIAVQLDDAHPPPTGRLATALYRMVQEGLTNAARHARARHVDVDLCRDGDVLVLSVTDDGVGLPEDGPQRDGGYGLMGMRERVAMLGGTLEVGNADGARGTRLTVRVPLEVS
ncbi:MAG: PAS domain S-box protein [Aquincola sp.]|nr:PAS domain S-box protein [Aquincola sp.]MDH5329828.1 PAS domain S-box protein [Aquincola sp.]